MRTTKEAELNAALLQYVNKCLAQGDDRAVAHLGLDRHDAEVAAALSLMDLDHLTSLHFPLLREGSIDRDLFHRLIDHVRRLRALTSVRDELLARDAPLPLMHHLFGMESGEYAERGRRLGVIRPMGRPSEPEEAEEAAVWQAYAALRKSKDEDLTPEDYIELCKATGLSLRTIWLVISRAPVGLQARMAPPRRKAAGERR